MRSELPRRHAGEVHDPAEELGLLYDTAPVGLCVIDASGRFLRINRRLAEINGVPAEAHIGRTIREVVPSLADTAEAVLRRVVETGQPVLDIEVEGETPAHPGMRRTWLEDWSPLHDPSGRVVAVNVVAREVTAERRAARALRESEARLSAVLEVLPLGVGLIDMGGRLVVANREMRRFVPETIPSQDPARRDRWFARNPDGSRVVPGDYPGMRALRGETVLPGMEFQHALDDGVQVWARVAAVPLRDEQGAISGTVAVSWEVDRPAGLMRLRWQERGGPSLAGPPGRAGFGSRVIQATIRGQLDGSTAMAWEPDGLTCDLAVPLDRLCGAGSG